MGGGDLLTNRRVLLVGLEPWGAIAAAELAMAGVGVVRVIDDGTLSDADIAAVRWFDEAPLGTPRRSALQGAIARLAPACSFSAAPLETTAKRPFEGGEGLWDLVIATAPGDDLLVIDQVARFALERGAVMLAAHVDGLNALIGPVVVPKRTTCWNCVRLRCLAHATSPDAERALHEQWLTRRPPRRVRTYLPSMLGMLGHTLALAAIDLLTDAAGAAELRGRMMVQNLVSLETSFHSALPVPGCPVCIGAPAVASRVGPALDPAMSPRELREVLAGVVDERMGIVGRLVVGAMTSALDPEFPITATAVLGDYDGAHHHGQGGNRAQPEVGSGKGLTPSQAMIGAVGEAVERYSAARIDPSRLLRSSAAAMTEPFLDPARLCLYSDSQYADPQFPYPRFDRMRPIEWALGQWLDDGAPVYAPALLTYFNYRAPRDAQFCQVSSSGLAAGPTFEDASLRASLELLERDAFMLSWMARRPGRRIVIDHAISVGVREVVRQLSERGARLELYLLDIGVDVPVVACVGFGDGSKWPGATVSLSGHLDPIVAAEKAILEQGHVGPYVRRLMVEGRERIPEQPDDVRTLNEHALYYVPASRARAFDFLGTAGELSTGSLERTPEVSLAELARRLRRSDLRIAVVDVTSPDLLGTPFRVARALGPDVQQIHFGHRIARLGNPRLMELAARGINPDPHPVA